MKKLIFILTICVNINLNAQEYFVSAKGGLNVREAPNTNSNIIGRLVFEQKVTIESYTREKLSINDTDKETGVSEIIEGEWVEVFYESGGLKGFVFDGFLMTKGRVSDYEDYRVIVNDADELGEIINIYDKHKIASKDATQVENYDGGGYFFGIYDGYLIIDYGSGPDRYFELFDLSKQQLIFSSDYYNISIKDSKVYFDTIVEIENEKDKPKCPQEVIDSVFPFGYSEKVIYHINSGSLERTGNFTCRNFP